MDRWGGKPKFRRRLTCQSLILSLRLRCATREGVLLLGSFVMNRRLAPCLIKFQHSLISIVPSKNVKHTSGFYWLVGTDSRSASSALQGARFTVLWGWNISQPLIYLQYFTAFADSVIYAVFKLEECEDNLRKTSDGIRLSALVPVVSAHDQG